MNRRQAIAPLLVLEMFEHAYAIDYGSAHAKCIDAFFANVASTEHARDLDRGPAPQPGARLSPRRTVKLTPQGRVTHVLPPHEIGSQYGRREDLSRRSS